MRKGIRVMDRINQDVLDLAAMEVRPNQHIVQVRKYPNGGERGKTKNGRKVVRADGRGVWSIVMEKGDFANGQSSNA